MASLVVTYPPVKSFDAMTVEELQADKAEWEKLVADGRFTGSILQTAYDCITTCDVMLARRRRAA